MDLEALETNDFDIMILEAMLDSQRVSSYENYLIGLGEPEKVYFYLCGVDKYYPGKIKLRDLIECVLIKEPKFIRALFTARPDLKEKYLEEK